MEDVELVFANAKTYNAPGSDVYVMAETLEKYFHATFQAKKRK